MVNLVLWSCTGLLAILFLVLGNEALQLCAIPVLVIAILKFYDWRARDMFRRAPGWIAQAAGPAVILIVAVILYGRLLIGDLPINHDHPVFLFRAWNTGTQLLSNGSLTGFSNMMFAGYPANSLYPLGTDLLVVAMRVLSLGILSWETAYCWALFIFVLSYPAALYALGRRFAGPWAGLLAALLGLVDRGAWFQSGWDFNLDWGVWSMGLSFSLCLWSLWSLDRLLFKAGSKNLLATSGFICGAILCHPMAVAILGIMLPAYILVLVLAAKLPAPGLWLPRVVAAGLLGWGLSAFWLVPFIGRQDWFEPLAYFWLPFETIVRGITEGNALAQFGPVFLIGGILGLALGTRRREPFPMFLLIVSGLLLFFSSTTFLLSFDILQKFPAIAHLQLERFSYVIRTAMLLGCGFLIETIIRKPASDPAIGQPYESALKRHGRRFLLAAMIAPFIFYSIRSGPYPFLAPDKPLSWASQSNSYHDLLQAADHLNSLDKKTTGRIAILSQTHDHLLVALPVYTGLPIFKIGFTPENNYRFKFESRDASVWKAVNISHVLSAHALHRPDLTELTRFGRLRLYRFNDFSPRRVSLTGPGQATVSLDEPEALDVQISNAGPDSRLIIHKARYALWQAELNGKQIPISGASIGDSPEVFMQLPVTNGSLHLRYKTGGLEWLGTIISWLSFIVAGLLISAGFFSKLKAYLNKRLRPIASMVCDIVSLTTLAVLVLGSLILVLRLILPSSPDFAGRRIISDLADKLPEAHAEVISAKGSRPCDKYKGSKIQCPGPAWNFAGEKIIVSDHMLRQCIWLHPIERAKFTLHFDNVTLGDHIQGNFGLDDSVVEPPNRHDVNLTVSFDNTELGRFTCPSRRGWHAWDAATPGLAGKIGRVTIQSDASFTGRRHFCFTAYITRDVD
jgi:6-pyruvoyl-tetrahydropterin synthase-like protein